MYKLEDIRDILNNTNINVVWMLSIAVFPIFLIKLVSFYLFGDSISLVSTFKDDSYFYFTIAENIATGSGITFDGIHTTNGFHPLWLLVNSILYSFSGDKILHLRMVGVISTVLFTFTWLISWIKLKDSDYCIIGYISLCGLLYPFNLFTKMGMEITLLIPLVFLALYYIEMKSLLYLENANLYDLLFVGSLLALAQLARLDFVIFNILLTISLIYLNKNIILENIKGFLSFLTPIVLMGGMYVCVNFIMFGTITPLSSDIKSIGDSLINTSLIEQFATSSFISISIVPIYLGMLAVSLAFTIYYLIDRQNKGIKAQISLIISVFLISHLAYYILFSNSSWAGWYYYPAVMAIVWPFTRILTILFDYISKFGFLTKLKLYDNKISYIFLIIMLVYVFMAIPTLGPVESNFRSENYEVAQQTNELFEEGTVLAMGDRAGSYGYFSEYAVVHLEGLVNNKTILLYITSDELPRYMSQNDIDYLIYNGDIPESYSSTVISPTNPNQTVETSVTVYQKCEVLSHSQIIVFDWKCVQENNVQSGKDFVGTMTTSSVIVR